LNSHHTPNLNIVSNTLTADEVAFGDWIVNGPISGEHWYFNWTEEKIMNEEKGVNLVTTTSKCGCGLTGVHLPGSMCDMASRSLGNGWIAYNGGAPRGCEGQYQVIGKNEYEGGVVTLVNGGRPQSHINWNAVVYYRKVEEENLRHFTEGATLSALLDRMALDDCPKKLLVRAIQAKGDQSIKDFIEETSEQHMKTLERKGYEFTWLQEEQRKMREAAEKADFEAFCRLVCKRVNNLCMDRCTFDPKTLQFTFYDLDVVWHNTPLLREFHMRGGDPRDVAVIIRNTTNPLRARAEQRQNREKNVTHVAGNRYRVYNTEYLLCFLSDDPHGFSGATLVNPKSGKFYTHRKAPLSGRQGNRYVTEGDFSWMLDNMRYKLTHKAGDNA